MSFLAGSVVFVAWQIFSAKLTISPSGTGVEIQTLRLGEYAAPVSKLVIYEGDTAQEVVRFTAKRKNACMYSIVIRQGVNEFHDMYYVDQYLISYPLGRPYSFKAGLPYRVVVQWRHLTSERTFILPQGI